MLFGFGRSSHRRTYAAHETRSRHHHGFRLRKDPDRVAGGYKAALANPNTTREGRKHAKHELRRMGRGGEAHVSFMTKVKRTLGIRSSPRTHREHTVSSRTRRTRNTRY